MVILRPEETGLKELLDRILDKGVAIDASVRIDLSSMNLLKTKARIILSSFKTAAEIGLDFPEGTDFDAPGWRDVATIELCPVCGMKSIRENLKKYGCPWCGWNYQPKEG
ncbi:MAG: gas vesicle protein GvpJ [Candidatus Bathyarchaeia archaeon]|nr:gas vesicle protein GvpJ [Candidatus Bathyarchaeia archaeon]